MILRVQALSDDRLRNRKLAKRMCLQVSPKRVTTCCALPKCRASRLIKFCVGQHTSEVNSSNSSTHASQPQEEPAERMRLKAGLKRLKTYCSRRECSAPQFCGGKARHAQLCEATLPRPCPLAWLILVQRVRTSSLSLPGCPAAVPAKAINELLPAFRSASHW